MRVVVVRALGNLASRKLLPVLESQFELDSSYAVQAEVVRAIGEIGDSAMVPFLEKAMRMRSPRDIVRTEALKAIERMRN